jgi:uncharacterized protein (DUF1778 family)
VLDEEARNAATIGTPWRPARLSGRLTLYVRCVYSAAMANVNERWAFRVASETDELVRHAAETADRTLTDFVVDAAVVEAERVLADRTKFVLEADQWERFIELLDRAPQEKPGLEKLFSQPSVFANS